MYLVETIFKKILSIIDKLPLPIQVFSLVMLGFVVLGYSLFKNEKVQKAIALKIQKKLNRITSDDLRSHKLFCRKGVYKNVIKNIKFESVNKTDVFQILLMSKLDNDIKLSTDFISDNKVFELSKFDLCAKMISQISKMVEEYEKDALGKLSIKYGAVKADKLFDVVMNSPGGFRESRADRLNRIITQIDEYLRTSQIFDGNKERVEYFFTEIHYALRMAIMEAEKTFSNLNGEIDKIIKAKN